MNDLSAFIREKLLGSGADLAGIGDLSELPPDVRENMPIGISIALKYPKEIIRGIAEYPSHEYYEWYLRLNKQLDMLVSLGADELKAQGHEAVALTQEHVEKAYKAKLAAHPQKSPGDEYTRLLPHKTVATRAGLGWIGKSALLVTREYGSMIRISSILTNAPLTAAESINISACGNCVICKDACPANAVSGKLWKAGMPRKEFFDARACCKTAQERSRKNLGLDITICGKCIEICPHTRRYLE